MTLYPFLATFDVKKSIYDLAINRFDTQIAIVENQGMYNSVQESVVRLYDVGRRRDDEDEQVQNKYFNVDVAHESCDILNLLSSLLLFV